MRGVNPRPCRGPSRTILADRRPPNRKTVVPDSLPDSVFEIPDRQGGNGRLPWEIAESPTWVGQKIGAAGQNARQKMELPGKLAHGLERPSLFYQEGAPWLWGGS